MSCPRCGRETAPTLASCPGCGAPLALPDEPAPRALDLSLPLDRRAAERSHWDLGPALADLPGPAPGPGTGTLAPAAPAREPSAGRGPAPAPAPDLALDLPDAEVDAVEVHLRRGGGGRRALSWAVDLLPFLAGGAWLADALLGAAAGGPRPGGPGALLDLAVREASLLLPVAGLLAVALFVYATLAHALAGATLGKWIARLRVAGPDGRRPSLGRSAARSALAVLSVALLGLGVLAALFTRSGRALHDVLASTWVVEA